MKIQGSGGAGATGGSSRPQGPSGAGFTPGAAEVRDTAAAARVGSLGVVSSLDALLALQEAPGPMERRRRAVKRAGRLLDLLDDMKLSLLEGGGPEGSLGALRTAIGEARAGTDDPRLEGVLDEIETRAAVELAKEEMARHASAAMA